jgi:hypothetical protein
MGQLSFCQQQLKADGRSDKVRNKAKARGDRALKIFLGAVQGRRRIREEWNNRSKPWLLGAGQLFDMTLTALPMCGL